MNTRVTFYIFFYIESFATRHKTTGHRDFMRKSCTTSCFKSIWFDPNLISLFFSSSNPIFLFKSDHLLLQTTCAFKTTSFSISNTATHRQWRDVHLTTWPRLQSCGRKSGNEQPGDGQTVASGFHQAHQQARRIGVRDRGRLQRPTIQTGQQPRNQNTAKLLQTQPTVDQLQSNNRRTIGLRNRVSFEIFYPLVFSMNSRVWTSHIHRIITKLGVWT